MRFIALVASFALAAAASATQAGSPDPLFGDDPHANAVLSCHADYALRFASAPVRTQATPTEIATAAYAHCISQFNDFMESAAARARSSDHPGIYMDPEGYQADQIAKMREYSFAYTIDVYLSNTTSF